MLFPHFVILCWSSLSPLRSENASRAVSKCRRTEGALWTDAGITVWVKHTKPHPYCPRVRRNSWVQHSWCHVCGNFLTWCLHAQYRLRQSHKWLSKMSIALRQQREPQRYVSSLCHQNEAKIRCSACPLLRYYSGVLKTHDPSTAVHILSGREGL